MRQLRKGLYVDYEAAEAANDQTKAYCLSDRDVMLLLSQTDYLTWQTRWIHQNFAPLTTAEMEIAREWADHAIGGLVASVSDGCPEDSPDCVEYAPNSSLIQYAPMNPFNPGTPPAGYAHNPFYLGQDAIIPGLQPLDVVSDLLSSLPDSILDLPELIASSGFPRFRLTFEGTGQIELHLLKVPQGGLALITIDGSFGNPEIVDCSSVTAETIASIETILELLGFLADASAYQEAIWETEITAPGAHFIDVTFIPNATFVSGLPLPVVRWGGGLRKVVMCGFDSLPGTITVEGGSVGVIGEVDWLECDECPPETHLLCNGETYERSEYEELYDAIASHHKISGTQFTVPYYPGRSPMHPPDGANVGEQAGNETEVITPDMLPAHNHPRNELSRSAFELTTINSNVQQPSTLAGKFGWDSYLLSNAAAYQAMTTGYTGENEDAGTEALPVVHPVNYTLACIRYRNPDVVGLRGAPGAPGAPGTDGTDCDCEPAPPDIPTPAPQVPGTVYPIDTDMRCAAANAMYETLEDKLLNGLRELDDLEIIALAVAGVIAFAISTTTVGVTALVISISFTGGLLAMVGWMAGETNWRDAWDAEFKDDFICKVYCNLNNDGQFDDEGFEAFDDEVNGADGGEWNIIELINDIGGKGLWNQWAQSRIASVTDNCPCGCDLIIIGLGGTVVSQVSPGRWRCVADFTSVGVDRWIMDFQEENGDCFVMTNIVHFGNVPSASVMRWADCDNEEQIGAPPEGACVNRVDYTVFSHESSWYIEFDASFDPECQ